MRRAGVLLLAAGLAACAATPGPVAVPDAAALPPGAFGTGDDSPVAVAQFAFGDAGRTYGRPDAGARAAAALEYMAGAAGSDPAWQEVSLDTKIQLVAARAELRQVLHVRPGARAQAVVDALLAAAAALAAGDTGAAAALLDRSAVFAAPGTAEVNTLANLPYLRDVNLATQHAADELAQNDTEFRHF